VKARELRFEEVPETEVHPPAQTERENLPEEVEPGVVYRNPRVRLRIASALTEGDPDSWRDSDEGGMEKSVYRRDSGHPSKVQESGSPQREEKE
jgi:hypothetical protein